MPKQFEIVQAGQADIEVVAQLFDDYRVFYEQPSDLAAAKSFITDRVQKDDSVIYLARREGQALGFLQLYPTLSSVSMKRLWILNDLFVCEGGRQQGIGRALIDRAKQLAIDTEAKGLILETATDNSPAQALYDSYGFVQDIEYYRYALTL